MPQPHQRQQQQPKQLTQQVLPGILPPLINNREDVGVWETRKAATPRPKEQAINDGMYICIYVRFFFLSIKYY